MIDSIRRIEFVTTVRSRPIDPSRCDPASPTFDPIRAAILHLRAGRIDEAGWLVFLFVHFGINLKSRYRLIQDVYGGLGQMRWDWAAVSHDPIGFRQWLSRNNDELKARGGKFGNHHKYQSLDAWKPSGTGAAIESYVRWVLAHHGHRALFAQAQRLNNNDPLLAFDYLYKSLGAVISFGRTAKFDYLTMAAKVGLTDVQPPRPYMQGATGPLAGAKLLFGRPRLTAAVADREVTILGNYLKLGMQVMEDSLCNWQKSPLSFEPFRG
jgi:hypothetical protein